MCCVFSSHNCEKSSLRVSIWWKMWNQFMWVDIYVSTDILDVYLTALRCICKSCRLVKCLQVGMKREAVQKSRVPLKASKVTTRSASAINKTTAETVTNVEPRISAASTSALASPSSALSSTPSTASTSNHAASVDIARKLALQSIINKSKVSGG